MKSAEVQALIDRYIRSRARRIRLRRAAQVTAVSTLSLGLTLVFASPGQQASSMGFTAAVFEGVGLVLLAIALVAFVMVVLFNLLGSASHSLTNAVAKWKDRCFVNVKKVVLDQLLLRRVYDEDARALGDGQTEWEDFCFLFNLNHEYLACWVDRGGAHEIRGFYLMAPLKVGTTRRLLNGVIRKAADIPHDGYCKVYKSAAAIYVHDVISVRRESHFQDGHIVELLLQALLSIVGEHRGIRYVFARPVTSDGLRLVRRYGFKQISPGESSDSVWVFDLDRIPRIRLNGETLGSG